MDHRLVAWGRAVKARLVARGRSALPPLWLFTDPVRTPDVLAAVAALPAGLCGVVFRHDGSAGRAALLRRVGQLCRTRRLRLSVAGDGKLPPGAGRHLREGRGPRAGAGWTTSSAHGPAGLRRARRAGAAVAFLSPAFPTESHRGAPALGALRWSAMASGSREAVAALGGIDGRSVRLLPRWVRCVGAIGALAPSGAVTSRPQCFAIAMKGPGSRLRGQKRHGNTSLRSG